MNNDLVDQSFDLILLLSTQALLCVILKIVLLKNWHVWPFIKKAICMDSYYYRTISIKILDFLSLYRFSGAQGCFHYKC